MNVVVIGSGGREHALVWKISQSPTLNKLYSIPGNPGTKSLSQNVLIDISDHQSVINFCKENNIDLCVIGPEQPLVDGLADDLRKSGINVFGPGSKAAMIEASKSFAKGIMKRGNIPTGDYKEFKTGQIDEALSYTQRSSYPLVIKADGLAAGKGVIICSNYGEASEAINEIFVQKVFGSSGNSLIIEEFLVGEEASIFAITDGNDFVLLPPSQDHKRIGDKDTGKNTGGMGAYAPAPIVTEILLEKISREVIAPTLTQMKKEGNPFIGCLYAGLMISGNELNVVEFNCRFGDPETQVVLPLIQGDFLQLLYSAAIGKLDKQTITGFSGSSVCVIAASQGYPDKYEKGCEIIGLENKADNTKIFHSGTKSEGEKIVTNGGRVLGITSIIPDENLKEAQKVAYDSIKQISFNGIYYRSDIAEKAFNKK